MTLGSTRTHALTLFLLLSSALHAEPTRTKDPRFATVRLKTGVDLHYAARGTATGEPVILLHGYSDSWFSYSAVLDRLPANLRVYAIDMRGHGRSTKPKTGYAMTEFAADVIAFMDAKSLSRATIVGHSLGGLIAQRVAEAVPQRVARLVLVSTATAGRHINGAQELHAAITSFVDSVPLSFIREFQISTAHAPVPAAFMERAISESRRLPIHVWRSIANGIVADRPPVGWPQVRIPTLVLWGDRDTYATRAEQTALIEMIPGAELKTYVNTGHAMHWERPAEFARDLTAFIARD